MIHSLCQVHIAGRDLLASAGMDGAVRIWDPETGKQVRVLKVRRGRLNAVCQVRVAGQELLASVGFDRAVPSGARQLGRPVS